MHKCVRCGRIAVSLEEIDAGCPCGSKVFVFGKESVQEQPMEAAGAVAPAQPPPNGEAAMAPKEAKADSAQGQAEKTVVMEPVEPDGHVPSSYYARTSFTSEDVENIKVLTEGVFLIDVKSLSRDPMVLKDEEGIYYVKIPFEQKKNQASENGNGRKA